MLGSNKGIAIGTIMKLTLALMTASLFISVGTLGALGKAISEGFGSLKDSSDYTVDIEQSGLAGKKKLSQAAKYVRQKAGNDGCSETRPGSVNSVYEENHESEEGDPAGYPALADTYLGRYPDCVAGSSGGIRGIQGAVQQLGKDQEGIYSRVGFEINKKITLNTNSGETWLEDRLWGAARGSLNDNTVSSCNQDAMREALAAGAAGFATGALTPIPGDSAGFALVAAAGSIASSPHYVGTGDHFVIFVKPDNFGNRVNGWLNSVKQLNGKMYCYSLTDSFTNNYISLSGVDHAVQQAYQEKYSGNFRITLCPGDVGYIQMNKGKPNNNGEASEDITGSAHNYPHIVITQKGDDCTPQSQNNNQEPVTGTVTTEITRTETGNNDQVIDYSDSSFTFRPTNSPSFSDYLVWQPLPEGDKTVTVKTQFSHRGHLQIDLQENAGDYAPAPDTVTYMNTGEQGGESIYINKTDGSYIDTGADYEIGKNYTFQIERNGQSISWTVEENENQIYSYQGTGPDFRRLVLESWIEGQSPTVEIKKVKVEEN